MEYILTLTFMTEAGVKSSLTITDVKSSVTSEAANELMDTIIENNIFKSVYNVNLRTVIQYEYKGKKYNFMDTYDDYDPSVQADDDDEGIE